MVDHEMIASREAITQTALAMGDVQASHIAIYLTMIFAYISVAYIAGTKLTRLQLALTSFVFVAASAREVISIAALTAAASGKLAALSEIGVDTQAAARSFSMWYPILIWSTGIFASLVFMWSSRHPKTE